MPKQKSTYPDLKTWRTAKQLTQEVAAARLGIRQWDYSRIETRVRVPKPKIAKSISLKTGVSLESVLGL